VWTSEGRRQLTGHCTPTGRLMRHALLAGPVRCRLVAGTVRWYGSFLVRPSGTCPRVNGKSFGRQSSIRYVLDLNQVRVPLEVGGVACCKVHDAASPHRRDDVAVMHLLTSNLIPLNK